MACKKWIYNIQILYADKLDIDIEVDNAKELVVNIDSDIYLGQLCISEPDFRPYNLDFFFLQLQQLTGTRLYEKESLIIFDEVQLLPKARQAISTYINTNNMQAVDATKRAIVDLYEEDFTKIDSTGLTGDKICPLEVKSGNYRTHKSLDVFCDKFNRRIKDKYVVHTKDYKWENGINYIPVYMVPFM